MSEAQNCNHDCGSCTANCDSRVPDKKSFEEKLAEGCSVKKVIGVVSGKGGVGKSLVTSLMACQMRARGYKVKASGTGGILHRDRGDLLQHAVRA